MQNRLQIFYIAVSRIVKNDFLRTMNALNCEKCEKLIHLISNNPVIDGKKIISTYNVTYILHISIVGCPAAANITGYAKFYFNKKFHGVYRTFRILFPDYHLPMISQNFVNCKQNFKNLDKKIMKIEY
jgi:hypothetical protein